MVTHEIRDSRAVWQFFHDRLGLHQSHDFRGVCHLAPDIAPNSPVNMDAVAVAVGYNAFIGRTCCMHVVVQRPEAMSPRIVREAFEYPFNVCGCEAVLALVDSANEPAIHFDSRLGFKEIARIENGATEGDLVVLRMTRSECRWLRQH